MSKIISKTILFDKPEKLKSLVIEDFLTSSYGDIIRWAITEVDENSIKISFSYKQN